MGLRKGQTTIKLLQEQLAKYEQKEQKLCDIVIKERSKTGKVSAKHIQEAKELDTTILSLRKELLTLLDKQ